MFRTDSKSADSSLELGCGVLATVLACQMLPSSVVTVYCMWAHGFFLQGFFYSSTGQLVSHVASKGFALKSHQPRRVCCGASSLLSPALKSPSVCSGSGLLYKSLLAPS